MLSRVWVGVDTECHSSVPRPLRWILNKLFKYFGKYIRKLLIPKDLGMRNLAHMSQEMNQLASFLPELYHKYYNNNNNNHSNDNAKNQSKNMKYNPMLSQQLNNFNVPTTHDLQRNDNISNNHLNHIATDTTDVKNDQS